VHGGTANAGERRERERTAARHTDRESRRKERLLFSGDSVDRFVGRYCVYFIDKFVSRGKVKRQKETG